MNIKGKSPAVLERLEVDRIGFVAASVKQTLPANFSGSSIDAFFSAGTSGSNATGLPVPYPDILGSVCTRAYVENENGVAVLRWIYEGIASWVGDQDEALMWCNFDRTLNTVPIQAHPDFKSWVGVYGMLDESGNWLPFASVKDAKNSTQMALFPNSTGIQQNPLLGADSYYTCGGVWTARYSARILDAELLTGTGSIIDTADLPQNDLQNPPSVPVDSDASGNKSPRNWLYTGPQLTWRGNAWEVVEQYVLSGRGGWVPEIYNGNQN
jgi:hypothetical protein